MKNNFYIICNNNKNLFPDVFFGLKEKHRNIVSFNIDEFSEKTRKIIFSKFYMHVPEDKIESSGEYKHIFKNIEEEYIEQMLLTASKNNKNSNILFYGDFEAQFGKNEWINKIEDKLNSLGWNVFFLFLEKRENQNSKIATEVIISKKAIVMFTTDDFYNFTQGFEKMKKKQDMATPLDSGQKNSASTQNNHDKLFNFFTGLLILVAVFGLSAFYYISDSSSKKLKMPNKKNIAFNYQYIESKNNAKEPN